MLKIAKKKRINTIRFFIISHLSYHKGSQRIRYKSPLIHYITKVPPVKRKDFGSPKHTESLIFRRTITFRIRFCAFGI